MTVPDGYHDVIWTDEAKVEIGRCLPKALRQRDQLGQLRSLRPRPKHAYSVSDAG
jgi:hypothetical protein